MFKKNRHLVGQHKTHNTKECNYVMEIRGKPDVWKPSLCRLAVFSVVKDLKCCTGVKYMTENKHIMDNEMTSSDQVLLEETRTLNETELTQHRSKALYKIKGSFSFESDKLDENENVFVRISEVCKSEAARQSNMLLRVAEGLCSEKSPTLQRKGKVFKKLAPEVEKHVFNDLQRDLCQNMWQEARQRVYGTPSNGAVTNCTCTATNIHNKNVSSPME